MDIFKTVSLLPLLEVIKYYHPNIEVMKVGDRIKILCPLHIEETPSFVIYKNNHWRCFGTCNSYGDGVDFVSKDFSLSPIEAAKKIAEDFGISVDVPSFLFRKPPLEKANETSLLIKRFKAYCHEAYLNIALLFRNTTRTLSKFPGLWETFAELIHKIPLWEYYMDILIHGTDEEKVNLFKSGQLRRYVF